MITCDLFGGLGNNLFQLAVAYSIHKKYGFDLILPTHVDRGNIGIYGQSTKLEFSNLFENKFIYDDITYGKLRRYTHNDVNPSHTDYTYVPIPITDNTSYRGYFQSELYFMGVDISKELILNSDNINLIKLKYPEIFNKKIISLHYRLGGDRITDHMQHYHKNVSIEYYIEALKLVPGNLEDYNILIFSDNMEKAKSILEPLEYNLIYLNNGNVLDFTFMTLCDVNIIGNSTYSWWSAYMNQNPNKLVICTESEWFGPGYKHFNLKDTFPQTWIRL